MSRELDARCCRMACCCGASVVVGGSGVAPMGLTLSGRKSAPQLTRRPLTAANSSASGTQQRRQQPPIALPPVALVGEAEAGLSTRLRLWCEMSNTMEVYSTKYFTFAVAHSSSHLARLGRDSHSQTQRSRTRGNTDNIDSRASLRAAALAA